MKKIVVAVSAVGLIMAINAQAAVPTGAAPFQVVVPNLKSGLEFTVTGLYLQPSNSDLDYATFVPNTVNNIANTSVATIDPSYHLGFQVELGYVFPNSGNDVQLSWTHFDHDGDSDSRSQLGGSVFTRTGAVVQVANTLTASGSTDVNYNAVDLDVGQYLSIGTRLQTRLFAGLRYAQIKNNLFDADQETSTSSTSVIIVEGTGSGQINSKFTGVGPRFGVNMEYHVGNCFGVVGQVAAAMLVGRVEASSSSVYTSGSSSSTLYLSADNQTRVVPALDAKLGLNYSWPINNDAQRFTIEAGYQVTQYIDAIDRVAQPQEDVTLRGNAPAISGSVTRTTSSIGFNGPYLSINYKI